MTYTKKQPTKSVDAQELMSRAAHALGEHLGEPVKRSGIEWRVGGKNAWVSIRADNVGTGFIWCDHKASPGPNSKGRGGNHIDFARYYGLQGCYGAITKDADLTLRRAEHQAKRSAEKAAQRAGRVAYVRQVWADAKPLDPWNRSETAAHVLKYLVETRGLDQETVLKADLRVIRYKCRVEATDAERAKGKRLHYRYPTIVAAIRNAGGQVIGLNLIVIDHTLPKLADDIAESPKRFLGCRAGLVWLRHDQEANSALGIRPPAFSGEGLEDGLSLLEAAENGESVFYAGCAGALAEAQMPLNLDDLTMWVHVDDSPGARKAARARRVYPQVDIGELKFAPGAEGARQFVERHHRQLKRLRVVGAGEQADRDERDANDTLRDGGRAAVQKQLREAFEIPLRRPELTVQVAPADKALPREQVDAAMDTAIEMVLAKLAEGKSAVAATTAGTGKSRRILAKLMMAIKNAKPGEPYYRKKVLFLTKTLKLAEELAGYVQDELPGKGKKSVVIYGKTQTIDRKADPDDPDAMRFCKKWRAIKQYRDVKAPDESLSFCKSDLGQCEFFDECDWRNQTANVRFIFATHDTLVTSGHPSLPEEPLIVIDEYLSSPVQFDVPVSALHDLPKTRPMVKFIGLVERATVKCLTREDLLAVKMAFEAGGTSFGDLLGELKSGLRWPSPTNSEAENIRLIKSFSGDRLKLIRAVEYLNEAADNEENHTFGFFVAAEDKDRPRRIQIDYTAKIHEKWRGVPAALLDADDNIITRHQHYNCAARFEVNARRNVIVFQLADRTNPISGYTGKAGEKRYKEQLNYIRRKAADGKLSLIVCCSKLEGLLKEDLADMPNIAIEHFGNIKGINKYEKYHRVFVIGRLQPNEAELDRRVRQIDPSQAGGLDAKYTYNKRMLIAKDRGQQEVIVAEGWNDTAKAVLASMREWEMAQAADRLRFIYREAGDPGEVHILCSIPVPGFQPDHLIYWGQDVRDDDRVKHYVFERLQADRRSPVVVVPLIPHRMAMTRRADTTLVWATPAAARENVRKSGLGLTDRHESEGAPDAQRTCDSNLADSCESNDFNDMHDAEPKGENPIKIKNTSGSDLFLLSCAARRLGKRGRPTGGRPMAVSVFVRPEAIEGPGARIITEAGAARYVPDLADIKRQIENELDEEIASVEVISSTVWKTNDPQVLTDKSEPAEPSELAERLKKLAPLEDVETGKRNLDWGRRGAEAARERSEELVGALATIRKRDRGDRREDDGQDTRSPDQDVRLEGHRGERDYAHGIDPYVSREDEAAMHRTLDRLDKLAKIAVPLEDFVFFTRNNVAHERRIN
jgi:hypothetical protein